MHKTRQKPGCFLEIRSILPKRGGVFGLIFALLLGSCWSVAWAQDQDQDARSVRVLLTGLEGAVALDRSPLGELFILEANRNRILKIDTLGNRVAQFGSRGDGMQQFDNPTDLEVTNGMRLYIADPANQRIQIFDRRFNFVAGITSEDAGPLRMAPMRAHKIAVNREGAVYAYHAGDHAIYRYDPYGRRDPAFDLDLFSWLKELSCFHLSSTGLWVTGSRTSALYFFSLTGQYLQFVEGFEGVVAMDETPEAAWLLTRRALIQCDLSFKQCHPYPLVEKEYIDLAIIGTRAYLLTAQTLYLHSL
jgi:hypothetical protein